ncbi:MAG: CheR family methyltransferase [Parachlamydiaceae bacterium]
MNEQDLEKVRSLIYKETGMLFEPKKDYYIATRLQQRMDELGFKKFEEYYQSLIFDNQRQELQKFIEAITINETYFFRDFPQLQGFAEKVLPPYLEKKRKSYDSNLKIWSAACSTGEEPYTLSIILQEMIDDYSKWNVELKATDIDRNVLDWAKKGLYSERSMKETPLPYRPKYFLKKEDQWQVLQRTGSPIRFSQLNFVDRSAMRQMRGFDFVFCRNVLIYFDEESRKKVVNSLYDSLVPGGYLFLGHSESIGRISAAFELQNVDGFLCYRRPL